MNRDDDQQLWDLLGRAAPPRVSSFFSRNVVRRIREEPGNRSWIGLKILIPALGVASVVITAILFARSSPRPEPPKIAASAPPQAPAIVATASATMAPRPLVHLPESVEPATVIESPPTEPEALAKIDPQDYEVVANLDDLLVLYETSVWEENSSL